MNKTTLYATLVFLISTYYLSWFLIGMTIERIKKSINIKNREFEKYKFFEDRGRKLKVETKLQNQIGGIIEGKHIS